MKVESKILEKSQAELIIEVSVEEAKPFIEDAAKRISKEVELKGFRKGKAPLDVIIKHVGEQTVYEEAFNAIVEETYPKAIEQEDLQVAGRANIDTEKIAPGNPIVYKATVPLMPKVELGNYKKLKTKKEEVEMDEAKFDKTLEDIRAMRASEKVVDRDARDGDKAVIDFNVKVDNVPIEGGQGKEQPLKLGSSQFIPGFEENVVGMKKGEEKTFETAFPKDYHKKDLAGKKAKVDVKLHDVYEIELPELDEEMAKSMNFESVEKLKEEIRKNITRELDQEKREKFENDVIEEIMNKSKIDDMAPQLIKEETDKMLGEMRNNMQQQGMKFEDYLSHLDKTEEELREEFSVQAEKRLKAAIVMREVAIAEDVKVDAAEIEKELEEMRTLYAQMPEQAQEIDSPAHRSRLENMMVHRKLFEALEGYAK